MNEIKLDLGIASLEVMSQETDKQGDIYINVRSTKKKSHCNKCGKDATIRYGSAPEMKIRHLPIFNRTVYLVIKPVRYKCEYCDGGVVTTEQYNWCGRNSRATNALNDYLLYNLVNSTIEDVATKNNIGYKTIENLVTQLPEKVDWNNIQTDIIKLGIDEISIKKGHQDYVTIVSGVDSNNQIQILSSLLQRLCKFDFAIN